jgi:tRNA A-37 threonylcarbamoyl transferase component Bud32/tetratricopeptide (TPR) repeat protein
MATPTCPADEQLVELLEGQLDATRAAELEAHVDRCQSCARLIAAYAEAAFERGDEPPPLGPGARIGRYFVLSFLGAGAMGMVYAAYDPQLDRKVALKLIRREVSDDADRQGRLVREAQALARVNHPNVTAVYDAGHDGNQIYLAMELVDGDTLDAWLRAERRSVDDLVEKFLAAGRGLAAAHAAGLVHRDFKPTNVLVTRDGDAKVTDFGLARRDAVADDDRPTPAASPSVTATSAGALIGTPRYMAPEQLGGDPADARSDQFSFCVALYEALYGEPPFPSATLAELAESFAGGKPLAPRDPRVPAWLRDVIVRGLAVDPANRFPTMDALLAALAADPRARRRRWTIAVAGLVVVAAATVGLIGVARHEPEICEGAGREVAATWNPSRAAIVDTRFRATGLPFADRVSHSVREALDRRADALVTMAHDACVATRQRGTQSEIVLDLQTSCLARQRDELAAIVDLFERPDHALVRDALGLVGALDPVSRCANVETLRAVERPPIQLRAQVDQLVRELAVPRAALVAGHLADVAAPLDAIEKRAAALHYPPLDADVALVRATLADARRDGNAAIDATSRAVFAAMTGHDDPTLFQACRELAVELLNRDGATAATPWLRCSRALAERMHDDPDVQADLAYLEALVADREGDARAAFALHEQALARREVARGTNAAELLPMLQGLTIQALEIGRTDEAVAHARRAMAIGDATLGPDHVEVAGIRLSLGYALASQHHGAEALAVLAAARPVLEREYGPDHEDVASLHEAMADAFDEQNRVDEAIPHYVRAIAIRRKLLGPSSPAIASGLYNLATTLNRHGQYAAALGYLDQALPIYAAANSDHHVTVGVCELERGRAFHELGNAPAALAALERARPILVDQLDDAEVLGELHHMLAIELWTAKRHDDARTAMRASGEAYAKGGKAFDAARADTEKWLAAHTRD